MRDAIRFPLAKKVVLVTGAGGYLGSQLIAALAAGRVEVSRVVAADVREVPPERRLPGIEYVQADVRSPALIPLFDQWKVDVVVHLAAKTHDMAEAPGVEAGYQRVNVEGTRRLLAASVRAGVKRVVFVSSVKVIDEAEFHKLLGK